MSTDFAGDKAFNFGDASANTTNAAKATPAEKAINVMVGQETELQNTITELQGIYAYLERQQNAVKSEHSAAMSSVRSKELPPRDN